MILQRPDARHAGGGVAAARCRRWSCWRSGLSGLSVGLGAIVPNFRETDPSKIAVGFGGTLNLVAGLDVPAAGASALMAVPYHLAARLSAGEGCRG